jgi:hypothetical protein
MHLKFDKPAPFELIVWNLVKETGWTLDYIDSLPLSKIYEHMEVNAGIAKARK